MFRRRLLSSRASGSTSWAATGWATRGSRLGGSRLGDKLGDSRRVFVLGRLRAKLDERVSRAGKLEVELDETLEDRRLPTSRANIGVRVRKILVERKSKVVHNVELLHGSIAGQRVDGLRSVEADGGSDFAVGPESHERVRAADGHSSLDLQLMAQRIELDVNLLDLVQGNVRTDQTHLLLVLEIINLDEKKARVSQGKILSDAASDAMRR